jgi:hypothetical protein
MWKPSDLSRVLATGNWDCQPLQFDDAMLEHSFLKTVCGLACTPWNDGVILGSVYPGSPSAEIASIRPKLEKLGLSHEIKTYETTS